MTPKSFWARDASSFQSGVGDSAQFIFRVLDRQSLPPTKDRRGSFSDRRPLVFIVSNAFSLSLLGRERENHSLAPPTTTAAAANTDNNQVRSIAVEHWQPHQTQPEHPPLIHSVKGNKQAPTRHTHTHNSMTSNQPAATGLVSLVFVFIILGSIFLFSSVTLDDDDHLIGPSGSFLSHSLTHSHLFTPSSLLSPSLPDYSS